MQIRFNPVTFTQRHPLGVAIFSLFSLLYAPLLWHWCDGWLKKNISTEHEYFSHALLGIPFAIYLCWSKRDRWSALPSQPNSLGHLCGIPLLILGIVCYLSPLTNLINLSFPIFLTAFCLWFKGVPGLRLQAFPLLFVFLGTPNEIPYLIAPYTLPLQKFIAAIVGFTLMQLDMQIRVDQIYVYVNDRIVEVAPYCAGLKMMFTSLYVGLMAAYWTDEWRDRSKMLIFFPSIIGISVLANIIRNAMLAYFHGTGNDAAFKWLHDSWGGDLYSAGMLGLIILLLRNLDRWLPAADSELDPSVQATE